MLCTPAVAGQGLEPWEGETFEQAIAAQNGGLQDTLRLIIPDHFGCLVTGPLDITLPDSAFGFHTVRIVTPDIQLQERTLEQLERSDLLSVTRVDRAYDTSFAAFPPGIRGALVILEDGREISVFTAAQLRFLLWYRDNLHPMLSDVDTADAWPYARAVSSYLDAIEMEEPATPPVADSFGLPATVDLYAPAPDYVIQGYQNYKDFLQAHAAIYTDFVKGVLGFIPTDSLSFILKATAPKAAFPNKEFPKLQEELREFFERNGDFATMQTLTRAGFDTLRNGEYFFAVGLNGTVRFGRELLREEVKRIESETGKKAPRANHAFLFPGEPLLTAGAFFVHVVDSLPRLSELNAQSGHYFYSNVTPTIREDIAEKSDYYLLTLGHFLDALDSLGIDYSGVLIRKF